MASSCVTFVTCYMNLYDTPFENKDVDWRFGHFKKIADTGIQLCVFCSPEHKDYLENFAKAYPNIRIMKYISIKDTWSHKLVTMLTETGSKIELPAHRNEPKDTVEYICMMHSKIEFLEMAIAADLFQSSHFAWIDFNVAYIFKDNLYVQEYLRVLAQRTFVDEFIAIPGCWEKQSPETCLLDNICWRFCGGFFIGSKAQVLDFYMKYMEYFPMFLETHKKLIWEVNFWAWLEANTDWSPTWFKGDHNDSIIQITTDICNRCLRDTSYSKTSYFYPPVETYEASSASHVLYRGQHILNTRYVNYWYRPSGHCNIIHEHNWIISKNFMSVLELDENNSLDPTDFMEMDDTSIGLKSHDACFFGLEDIRLFVLNDELRFICTNINYSPTGRNRMITGKYNIDTASYSECRILHPPNLDSWCEKNWIPLIKRVANGLEEEHFIYKWWPFEVGKVNRERDQLEIVLSYRINSPLFMKVRGSTAFVETEEGLVGLVHYSEDTLPRHYYHIMVLLDKVTFQPLKYSDIFCFEKIGIEFCIGLWYFEGEYHFWISRMDREPLYLKMRKEDLPLKFDFSIL